MVRGDWRKESQSILTTQEFWFWLQGISERNLNLTQPHRILVLVKGDWRKESQSILTTHEFWFWLEGIDERNLSLS